VQTQPNYFISSGNNITATIADIKVNTDPDNVTPDITLEALLLNFSSVRVEASAAHAQYINNIEACADASPQAAFTGSQPASIGSHSAAVDSLLDVYFSKVKNGTVTPHTSRRPGTRGRLPGNLWRAPNGGGSSGNRKSKSNELLLSNILPPGNKKSSSNTQPTRQISAIEKPSNYKENSWDLEDPSTPKSGSTGNHV
jgi:hypothetical protein